MEPAHRTAESAVRFHPVPIGIMNFAERMRATPVASIKEGGPIDCKWGIKSPAERAVENAVTRNEGVAAKPGIPIPAGSDPAWSAIYVKTGLIGARLGQVSGAQRGPAEEIVLVLARVKILSFGFGAAIQSKLSFLAQINFFVVDDGLRLAFEDANRVFMGIESIQAVLQDFCGDASFIDTDIVVLSDIGGFEHGAALVNFDFGIRETGFDHFYRAVVIHSKEDTRSKQDFHFAGLRLQRLSGLQLGGTYR